jgi:two-component system, LuxR family, sensor kinase FixL
MEPAFVPDQSTAIDKLLQARPAVIYGSVALLIAALVLAEWNFGLDVSLGVLYVLPVVLAGTKARRWQIIGLSLFCALVRGCFSFSGSWLDESLLFIMATIAYSGSGLLVIELRKNRQLFLQHLAQIDLRRETEEQLRVLAESSPAAIMTLNEEGTILAANRATYEMLAITDGSPLQGKSIGSYLPVLADALKMDTGAVHEFRTEAQCWGKRQDGSSFVAQTWFSTYPANGGRRLAAIAVDISEEVRDREEQNLRLLLRNNRVLAGAVSHEVRNLCAAISVVSSNLQRLPGLAENKDFQALETLIQGLSSLARYELRSRSRETLARVDLHHVLDRFQLISEPNWTELGGSLQVQAPAELPPVLADPQGLLQVFLNLEQNSRRAVENSPVKQLTVEVETSNAVLLIRFTDSGPGIAHAERLFQPFQAGATSTGLGLYVSRALIRSFRGELSTVSSKAGACFEIELKLSPQSPALSLP